MTERKIDIYISDIISSIDRILSYIETVDNFESFSKNQMVIDAVTRNFEIIGEITNKLPASLKENYPEIPWRQMYGLRNFAIHEYHIIDNRVIWEIATEKLIANKIDFEQVLANLKS